MDEDQNYTEDAAKNLKKTQVVSRGCAKMYVAGVVVIEGHAPPVGQLWVLLLNGFSQTIELLAVFGGIDSLIFWEQLIINHSLDISPQHHLLRMKFDLRSSLRTTNLRSPEFLYVIIRRPSIFRPR